MREMYYTTQPMEVPDDLSLLESTFKAANAETQFLWSSDYPHWQFEGDLALPDGISDDLVRKIEEEYERELLEAASARHAQIKQEQIPMPATYLHHHLVRIPRLRQSWGSKLLLQDHP